MKLMKSVTTFLFVVLFSNRL